jgi:arylformamidase
LPTRYGTIDGANHFTAIAPLADPASPMVLRLAELARR